MNKMIGSGMAIAMVLLCVPSYVFAKKAKPNGDSMIKPTSYADASTPGGTDGCGLGWQVTDKKTLIATTTRGTTNSVVPPTFGMSSGTIGCEQHSFSKRDENAVSFVAQNFAPLKMELAKGGGEYTETLLETLGCSQDSMSSAGILVQKHYSTVVTPASDAVILLNNVKEILRTNSEISRKCGLSA